ncbi:MAG: DUF3108 domain-containing protein [Bacteroidota bacterium]
MKKLSFFALLILLGSGFITADSFRRITNDSFIKGEHLAFRVHYGFINAGEASVDVGDTLYKVNSRICYKVNVYGKSTGVFDLGMRIRNTYRSYIDTAALIPHQFYLNAQEGRYRKEERVFFDQKQHMVKSEEKDDKKQFQTPQNVQDIVSGYYFLRTVNFNKLHVGDTIRISAFFDDEFYDFKVRYRGKGEVKTRFGKIRAIQITPIMPANKLFDGDSSIRAWISDDSNKIPIKIEADLFVGAVEMDLKEYSGLKKAPKWY